MSSNVAVERAEHLAPESWRLLCAAVTPNGGTDALAEALHGLTGVGVVIADSRNHVLARAGTPHGTPPAVAEPGSTIRRIEGSPRRRPTALPGGGPHIAHAGGWWEAPVIVDDAHVATVYLRAPAGPVHEQDHLVVLEQAAAAVGMHVLMERLAADRELRVLGDLVAELLDGPATERLSRRALQFGFDLDQPYRAVVAEPAGAGTPPARFSARCYDVIRGMAAGPVLAAERDGRFIGALADELDWQQLSGRLSAAAGEILRIGVGGREPLRALLHSVTGAEAALRTGPATHQATVASYDDLGIWQILARAADANVDGFIDTWLGALLRYDARRHTQLVRSLATFFACNRDIEAAAAHLGVHRNTLKYRLARIAEVGGVDLGDRRRRLNLEVACEAWAMRQP